MGAIEILGLAGSLSLLSGWRMYLVVFATSLSMHFGWLHMPTHLHMLDVLASPWIMGASALGLVCEFFADKVAWFDTIWDIVHTVIRPVGGALLSLAIVDPQDTTWQVVAFLLGGGAALIGHSAKAGARGVINASPEPFSNIAVSTGEDVVTTGMLALAIANPLMAVAIFVVGLLFSVAVIWYVRRAFIRFIGPRPAAVPARAPER